MVTKEQLDEIWIDCVDMDGSLNGQKISSYGRFIIDGNIVKPYISTNGHQYGLYRFNNACIKLIPIEHIMSINFMHTTDFERFYIKHRDANLANNRLENLEIIKRNIISKPLHFRDIVDDRYTVTDTGHIFRDADGSELVGSVFKIGYRYSSFPTKQNIYKKYTFHQIIATLFVLNPNPQIYNVVNHIDGDKLNNDILNLEWCDPSINSNHAAYIQHMTKISVEEIDMIRDMLLDEKYHGSAASVYDAIRNKFPHITLKMICAIKHKAAYNRSNIFEVDDIRFPEYTKQCIPTEDLDMVRDILLTPECLCSPTKAYKSIDHSRYPYITAAIIKDIKRGTKPYRRSNKYDINELDTMFKSNQQHWRGVYQKMKAIERNDNRTLDICRKLLQLRVFKGSIQAVYNAIDKTSHPNITIAVLKHLKYDDTPSSSYYRTDSMDLDRFYTDMKNGIFHVASREFIDELTISYSNGNSDITDEAFDEILEDYISEHGEKSRPFLRVNKSDELTTLQQTLSKVYGVTDTMRENQLSYEKWLSKKSFPEVDVCLQPKFDGCSVAVDFTTGRFFTRGDYDDGESVDVTALFAQHMQVIKMYAIPGTVAMKFEAILSRDSYHDIGFDKVYKRPRDVVSATITSRNVENAAAITLIPLRGYDENGKQYIPKALYKFSSCLFLRKDDFEGMNNFIKQRLDDDATIKFLHGTYDIDGVVASPFTDINGTVYTNPDNEIAIKILFNVKKTKLLSVEYQFGKQGRITPVAILEPVNFGNIEVDHVTLSTLERIMEMGLKHNDTVRVMYNIVPYLIDSEHDGDYPIQLPKNCPMCNFPLEFPSLRQVRCTNPQCMGLRLGSIIRFAEKMKMVGVSKGTITRLYDEGIVTSIPELLKLKPEQFNTLSGFGDTSANNIVNSIRSNSTNVSVTRCLGALPITDISEETWRIIVTTIGEDRVISELRAGTFVDLMVNFGYIPTVGDLKMRKIIDGYIQHRAEIQEILSLVTFKQAGPTQWKEHMGRVCLTGTRDADIIQALEDSGYEVGGFSKDCKFVVIPYEGFTSAKTEKAKELGIPVYTIEYVKWHEIKPF